MTEQSVAALLHQAREASTKGEYNKACDLAAQALTQAQPESEQSVLALVALAEINRLQSKFGEALRQATQAYTIAHEFHHSLLLPSIRNTLGAVYWNLGAYDKALEYYSKALADYEQQNDSIGIARVMGNIGLVYHNLGSHEKALEYMSGALNHYEQLGDTSSVAYIMGNMGIVHDSLGSYQKGLGYYTKALSLHEDLGEKSMVALTSGNIGSMYSTRGFFEKGLEQFDKALHLYQELGDKAGIALVMGNIGDVYANDKFSGVDLAKAEDYLLRAVAINQELGIKQNLYYNYRNLADLYEKLERWKEYARYFKKYYEVEKELQSEEAQNRAQQLDFERKQVEVEKQYAIERAEAAATRRILHNTLPPIIADRLIADETFIADHYDAVSILFMDLVNFTRIAAIVPPKHLIYVLNAIFSAADAVMEKHGLEKIKTIGDAYMAAAGAPLPQEDHALRAALAACELLEAMNSLQVNIPAHLGDTGWIKDFNEIPVRIGLHCGVAVGGVIGDKKFTFDLWGDAVNTAARMEQSGEAGKIHVSEDFVRQLSMGSGQLSMGNGQLSKDNGLSIIDNSAFTINNSPFTLNLSSLTIDNCQLTIIPRGEMEIKGKEKMKTYFMQRAYQEQ